MLHVELFQSFFPLHLLCSLDGFIFSILSPENPEIESYKINLLSLLDTSNLTKRLNTAYPLFKSWLGVRTIDTLLYSGIPILSISPESPATQAGLKPGNIIESIDNTKISSTLELINYLKTKQINQNVILEKSVWIVNVVRKYFSIIVNLVVSDIMFLW